MILFAGPSADTDRADHLASALDGNAPGEDHDLAVIGNVDPEELLTALRVLSQRFCIQIKGLRRERLLLRNVDTADPGAIHALKGDQVASLVDHGQVHQYLHLV